MIQAASLFNQLLQHFPRAEFAALVRKHDAERGASVITPKPARHDHLKTGQPTGSGQLVCSAVWSPRASILRRFRLYWPHLDGGYGNAGRRPERRSSGRNEGVAQAALPATFWREGDKSQGFGDRVPN
jgi:hypothetical protein